MIFLMFFLCLGTEASAQNFDSVIFTMINNCVRHEKRFLSKTDVFRIQKSPNGKLLVVSREVKNEDNVNFVAFVTPKDSTIKPQRIEDGERYIYTWISQSSDTIMLAKGIYSDRYTVSFSPSDVIIDYSRLPNRMYKVNEKIFVWQDDAYNESSDVINTLIEYNRVDYCVKDLLGWGAINDSVETICYDIKALSQGKIKKFHNHGLFGKGFRGRIRRMWYGLWR